MTKRKAAAANDLRTVYIHDPEQACRFVLRMCVDGYFFVCQINREYAGRFVSFRDYLDPSTEQALFKGITHQPATEDVRT